MVVMNYVNRRSNIFFKNYICANTPGRYVSRKGRVRFPGKLVRLNSISDENRRARIRTIRKFCEKFVPLFQSTRWVSI